jgi:cell division protein DivIC
MQCIKPLYLNNKTIMPEILKKIWLFIRPVVRNKYILTFIIFTVWITFFDTYNLVDRIKNVGTLRELQAERDFFKEEIIIYRQQIEELDKSLESLEKFAREQHLMKRESEDLYIIIEED